MGWTSAASRRHADLAWIGFGVGNEFRNRLGRNGWVHRYQKGPLDDRNGCDVADEIEIEVVIEGGVDCGSSIRTKERIAVGGPWRRNGHLRTPGGSAALRAARSTIRHREPGRRRQQYRHRSSRTCARRRLYAPWYGCCCRNQRDPL